MGRIQKLGSRVWNAAVFWTWIYNGLRLASGVLLLPLLIRTLPEEDFGMYINFFYLAWLLPLLDSAFSITLVRHLSYAMSGVESLRGLGLSEAKEGSGPNYELAGKLIVVTRKLYAYLSVLVLLVLGIGGTVSIYVTVPETSSPGATWLAWTILVCSTPLELYTSSWLVSLRGLNHMVLSARLSTFVYSFKLLFSCALLIGGFKLLAVPLATFITAVVQGILARNFTLRMLPPEVQADRVQANSALFRRVWPTSWRLGLQLLSTWITLNTFLHMISREVGLVANGQFGLSYQILYTICISIAATWTYVKWPLVSQYRATGKMKELRAVIAPRIWLQNLTFLVLAGLVITIGPWFVHLLDPDQQLLERRWLVLLTLYGLLELNISFWTAVVATENRIPSLWPVVFTNGASVVVALSLFHFTTLGIGAFVIAQFACSLAFNAWFWPAYGARTVQSTWTRFMFDLRGAKISSQ